MKNPFLTELNFYLNKAYPPFVTQKNPVPLKEKIPVFISHSVTLTEFEEKLAFLSNNNYRSITISKFFSHLKNNLKIAESTICLTFDDGHQTLYNIAFPLLKKYHLTATAFIVPAFIGDPGWITWEQAKEMSDQGIIEFQSHTLEHKKIFVSSKIISYNQPRSFTNELGLDKPTIILNGQETKDIPSGYPIYEIDSRMSEKLRYLGNNQWETREEQKKAILYDLFQAKKIIQEKINKPVEHLAYPWAIGSELSQQLSQEAGYLSNFWGPIPGLPYNSTNSNPFKLTRIKDDYIFRLPGNGRKSLLRIFSDKLKRRQQAKVKGCDIY